MQVECYSGHKADERPLRFRSEGHEYRIEQILDQWYGPDHAWYKVRADDGNVYFLRHRTSEPDGAWEMVSFRKAAG